MHWPASLASAALLAALLAGLVCAQTKPGEHGADIGQLEAPPARLARSTINYGHQGARRGGLEVSARSAKGGLVSTGRSAQARPSKSRKLSKARSMNKARAMGAARKARNLVAKDPSDLLAGSHAKQLRLKRDSPSDSCSCDEFESQPSGKLVAPASQIVQSTGGSPISFQSNSNPISFQSAGAELDTPRSSSGGPTTTVGAQQGLPTGGQVSIGSGGPSESEGPRGSSGGSSSQPNKDILDRIDAELAAQKELREQQPEPSKGRPDVSVQAGAETPIVEVGSSESNGPRSSSSSSDGPRSSSSLDSPKQEGSIGGSLGLASSPFKGSTVLNGPSRVGEIESKGDSVANEAERPVVVSGNSAPVSVSTSSGGDSHPRSESLLGSFKGGELLKEKLSDKLELKETLEKVEETKEELVELPAKKLEKPPKEPLEELELKEVLSEKLHHHKKPPVVVEPLPPPPPPPSPPAYEPALHPHALYQSPKLGSLPESCRGRVNEIERQLGDLLELLEHLGQTLLLDKALSYESRLLLSRHLAKLRTAAREARLAANMANLNIVSGAGKVVGLELKKLAGNPLAVKLEPALPVLALKFRQTYLSYKKACRPAPGYPVRG